MFYCKVIKLEIIRIILVIRIITKKRFVFVISVNEHTEMDRLKFTQ